MMRVGWLAALWVASWISPLLIRRLPPLDRLEPDAREDALNALSKSRIYLLRQVMLLLHGRDDEIRQAFVNKHSRMT